MPNVKAVAGSSGSSYCSSAPTTDNW